MVFMLTSNKKIELVLLLVNMAVAGIAWKYRDVIADAIQPRAAGIISRPLPAAQGIWRFIVSGDSRNCGDIVMPAIARHSARYAPSFYWHLGDLRAIYKIDEDMAYAAQHNDEVLSCDTYQRRAWNDFVENQIAPFGDVPFYVGIGNHEV